jgi:hypothetical protein
MEGGGVCSCLYTPGPPAPPPSSYSTALWTEKIDCVLLDKRMLFLPVKRDESISRSSKKPALRTAGGVKKETVNFPPPLVRDPIHLVYVCGFFTQGGDDDEYLSLFSAGDERIRCDVQSQWTRICVACSKLLAVSHHRTALQPVGHRRPRHGGEECDRAAIHTSATFPPLYVHTMGVVARDPVSGGGCVLCQDRVGAFQGIQNATNDNDHNPWFPTRGAL